MRRSRLQIPNNRENHRPKQQDIEHNIHNLRGAPFPDRGFGSVIN